MATRNFPDCKSFHLLQIDTHSWQRKKILGQSCWMRNIHNENNRDKTAFWGRAHSLRSWEIKRLMDGIHADICQTYGTATPVNLYFHIFIVSVAKWWCGVLIGLDQIFHFVLPEIEIRRQGENILKTPTISLSNYDSNPYLRAPLPQLWMHSSETQARVHNPKLQTIKSMLCDKEMLCLWKEK